MTNKNNTVLYVGVTSNLRRRTYQHKTGYYDGFTKRYNCHKLVYCEKFTDIRQAIKREKQLKAGNRKKKTQLIESINPDWKDLSEGWVFNVLWLSVCFAAGVFKLFGLKLKGTASVVAHLRRSLVQT